MPISLVPGTAGTYSNTSGAFSGTPSNQYTNTLTSGSLLIAIVFGLQNTDAPSSVVGSGNGAFTLANSQYDADDNLTISIWYILSASSPTADVITATIPAVGTTYIGLLEFLWGGATGSLDQVTSIATGFGGSPSVNIPATAANSVTLGAGFNSALSQSAGAGFTAVNTFATLIDEYEVASGLTAVTMTVSTGTWSIIGSSFKPAAAATGNPWNAYAQQ